MVKDGKKLEDVQAAKVTADFDEKWGKSNFMPPARYVEMLFRHYAPPAPAAPAPAAAPKK